MEQNFRSALNGFNREDVVRYIEYTGHKHTMQVNQLNSEIDELRRQLEQALEQPIQKELQDSLQAEISSLMQSNDALEQEKDALEQRCAQLEQELQELKNSTVTPVSVITAPAQPAPRGSEEELEAYRRAERTERLAQQRAQGIYFRVKEALTQATDKVGGSAAEIQTAAEAIAAQLEQLRDMVSGSTSALTEAADIIAAIREEEEL